MDYLDLFQTSHDPSTPLDLGQGEARQRIDQQTIRKDLSRMALVIQAVWELTGGAAGLQVEDLAKKMHEIDMRDGKLDGRNVAHKTLACPKCGKVLQKNTPVCIYCGQEVFVEPF